MSIASPSYLYYFVRNAVREVLRQNNESMICFMDDCLERITQVVSVLSMDEIGEVLRECGFNLETGNICTDLPCMRALMRRVRQSGAYPLQHHRITACGETA